MELFIGYTLTCLVLVVVPGPDNLLAIARGISQGRLAAVVSGCASGAGIMVHVLAATAGLSALLQTSAIAFWLVKLIGAAYLVWLGYKAIRSQSLIRFADADPVPLKKVFMTGFLSASLNPKVGMVILALVPQFIPNGADITSSMLMLGAWFALLTAIGFSLMGVLGQKLRNWLEVRPRWIKGANLSAGSCFVLSGFSVAMTRTVDS